MPDKPSIDQVAATDLAANLATTVDLPIATNVSNQAISLTVKSELSQVSDEQISKPQIVQPTTATHGITTYTVQSGDTVDSIASKFKLTKDTIKWSNDLQSDALEPGRVLLIPPVDGVIYTAQAGDTIASVAEKYKADPERVVLYNDLELTSAIAAGTKIIIPGGSVTAIPVPSADGASSNTVLASNLNFTASLSGGNRYDYGYCTWYAYNRRAALGRPVGGLWGNASSWASLARVSGFSVNNVPSVGAVLQTPNAAGGYGHVAVVESINPDGSILISEMNYAGWNVKSSRTISASQAGSYNYIH